jgi:hypothetical protein
MPYYRIKNDLLKENRIRVAQSSELKTKLRLAKKALEERRQKAQSKGRC